jgi:putative ABC transport system substrate-binding protein
VNTLLPLERGLIDSYARPGRNVTGVALYKDLEVTTKRLDFLKQIVPFATRLCWTAQAQFLSLETVSSQSLDLIPTLERAAREAGFEPRFYQLRQGQDLSRLFAEMVASSAQALMAAGPPPDLKSYIALALRYRLPTAFFDSDFVKAGGLLSYGLSDAEAQLNFVRCGEYVDRVLLGAAPESIPVYRPDRYEFVINLNTAKKLGLRVPQSLLLRADEVIQ